jgi:hypothetical protein
LAFLAAGLLALSACGQGHAPAATVPPASSPAPPGGNSATSFRIDRYTQIFATALPANEAQANVMEDFRAAWVLWDRADQEMRLVAPVSDYIVGRARTNLGDALLQEKTNDVVPAGADRFFLTRVTSIAGSTATITTCDDASKFTEVNPRTGRPDPAYAPNADEAYLFETWHMVRHSGHWAISALSLAALPNHLALACQP